MKDFMAIVLGIVIVCIIGFGMYKVETWKRNLQYSPQVEQMESSRVELRRIADSLEIMASCSVKMIERQKHGQSGIQLHDMQEHIGTIQVVPELNTVK